MGILDSLGVEYNMEVQFKDSIKNEKHILTDIDNEQEIKDNPHFDSNANGVQKGIKYCRNCGNKLPESAKFCDKCGSKIDY